MLYTSEVGNFKTWISIEKKMHRIIMNTKLKSMQKIILKKIFSI